MLVTSGYIINGDQAGKYWEIEMVSNCHYVLTIGGDFYASADSRRALLDELNALDGLHR